MTCLLVTAFWYAGVAGQLTRHRTADKYRSFVQRRNDAIERMSKHNGFFDGPHADLYSLLPFAVLIVLLYLTGREVILAHRQIKS